jgi:hypothetical protein
MKQRGLLGLGCPGINFADGVYAGCPVDLKLKPTVIDIDLFHGRAEVKIR